MSLISKKFLFGLIFIWQCLLTKASKRNFIDTQIVGMHHKRTFEPIISSTDFQKGGYNSSICWNLFFDGDNSTISYMIIGRYEEIGSIVCNDSELITPESNILIEKIEISNGSAHVEGCFPILETGLYTGFFVECNKLIVKDTSIEYGNSSIEYFRNIQPYIFVNGWMIFKNPYGLLPAHRYPYLSFYSWMSVYFGIAIIIWIMANFKHANEVFAYHHCILAILIFSFLEMVLSRVDIYYFNDTGIRIHGLYIAAKLASVARKALSRVVVICLCSGIGISRPELPNSRKTLLYVVTMGYFFVNMLNETYNGVNYHTNESIDLFSAFLHTVLVLMDTFIYFWMFLSLYETFSSLSQHEQYKTKLY